MDSPPWTARSPQALLLNGDKGAVDECNSHGHKMMVEQPPPSRFRSPSFCSPLFAPSPPQTQLIGFKRTGRRRTLRMHNTQSAPIGVIARWYDTIKPFHVSHSCVSLSVVSAVDRAWRWRIVGKASWAARTTHGGDNGAVNGAGVIR
jgi:hypothetical protein